MRCVVCLLLIALAVSLVSTAQVVWIPGEEDPWVVAAKLAIAQSVVIAIDTSGSITATGRLPGEIARAIAIVRFLAVTNPAVSLQVVAFNSDVKVVWPKPPLVTAPPAGNVEAAIRGIRGTNKLTWLNGVIDHACSITDPADPTGALPGPGTGTLVLLTDGISTTPNRNGARDIAEAARRTRVAARNFKLNCSTFAIIGIDVNKEDEQFLREIASPDAYIYMSTARIAVGATNIDGETDIYVMNSDGTELTNLTNTPDVFEIFPIWSPDGTRLMFETRTLESYDAYGRPYEIHSVNSDGTDAKNLTNTPRMHETYPSWSPDGTRIAFASCDLGRCGVPFGPYDIYVMNSDGTEPTSLTGAPVINAFPVWSPDGTQIMFLVGADLCIMDADGFNWRTLASGMGGLWPWNLSPNGAQIVFSAYTNMDNHSEICMVDVGGPDPGKLTRLTDIGDSQHPTWSPDGSLIAFARRNDTDSWEIYVMNPDGSDQVKLTDHLDHLGIYLDYVSPPMWSLDGRMIAYYGVGWSIDAHQTQWRGIIVVSADGSNQSVILEASFQENSDWLYFSPLAWEPRPAYDE